MGMDLIFLEKYKTTAADVLENKVFKSMDKYIHHSNISCLEHALHVSYSCFCIAEKLDIDSHSTARGALLHDFYLYDWHKGRPGNNHKIQLHGFGHPKIALKNAIENFEINAVEEDIIKKHMWPLTLFWIPNYKESFLVMWMDKYCSIKEIINEKTRNDIKNLVLKIYS